MLSLENYVHIVNILRYIKYHKPIHSDTSYNKEYLYIAIFHSSLYHIYASIRRKMLHQLLCYHLIMSATAVALFNSQWDVFSSLNKYFFSFYK